LIEPTIPLRASQADKHIPDIQRLYAMLRGNEIDPELEEEQSGFETSLLQNEPVPLNGTFHLLVYSR